jgi:hypothetical protein
MIQELELVSQVVKGPPPHPSPSPTPAGSKEVRLHPLGSWVWRLIQTVPWSCFSLARDSTEEERGQSLRREPSQQQVESSTLLGYAGISACITASFGMSWDTLPLWTTQVPVLVWLSGDSAQQEPWQPREGFQRLSFNLGQSSYPQTAPPYEAWRLGPAQAETCTQWGRVCPPSAPASMWSKDAPRLM